MKLSSEFSIDTEAPWVRAHNRQARKAVEAFRADRPIRVPLLIWEWFGQHGFYADETGLDYTKYYSDPDEMVRVQLEAARRRRELPVCDIVLGELPPNWDVMVDLWPAVAPGWFGCQLLYRSHSVVAYHGLELSRTACEALSMPDPLTGGILETCGQFWRRMQDRYEGKLKFLGRPVGPFKHGVGTSGFFSLALDLRGADLMVDLCEEPEFASRFLEKVAGWCDTLERTWSARAEKGGGSFEWDRMGAPVSKPAAASFQITDHGIDMLSAAMYERFIVPIVHAINRRRRTPPPTLFHHCGRGAHLFPVIQRQFGLTQLDALTFPLVDIARVRREVGEEVWINAIVEDSIIQLGSPERIRQTVKDLMTSGAKGKGRLALIMGDMLKGTPLDHRLAYYEAVKEFGQYS